MSDIACELSAIPKDEIENHKENSRVVFGAIRRVRELPDGYAFEMPADTIEHCAAFIARERLDRKSVV